MIDDHGYRPNVGIVLCNRQGRVFWARRCGRDGWQFPQGGIHSHEGPEQAMYRELREEVGLEPRHVALLGRTRDWLHYDIPAEYLRGAGAAAGSDRCAGGAFRGQKQLWFLLRLVGRDEDVCLDAGDRPEFDAWRWIEYWSVLEHVVEFKRAVYARALTELEPLLFPGAGD